MNATWLRSVFLRNLDSLRLELRAYPDEEHLWMLPPGVKNSGGTLVLHLAGNLQHFVGAVLGETGYQRDRDREFSARGISRGALEAELDAAEAAVRAGFANLTPAALEREFPREFLGLTLPTGLLLLQLVCHFTYHLGQVDLHRRTVTGDTQAVAVLDPGALTGEGLTG